MKDISQNYINIQGWMVSKLDLSSNDLLVFALVYGFCQDEESEFKGSINYVCNWLNCSRPTVSKSLNNLCEKDFLIKNQFTVNSVLFNTYKINLPVVKNLCGGSKETLQGGSKETLQGGSKETLHNNTILDNSNLNKDIDTLAYSELIPPKEKIKYDEVVNFFNGVCVGLPKIEKLTDGRKTAIKKLITDYGYEKIGNVFKIASESDFLNGLNGNNFKASFDWLLKPANFLKTLEGNYKNNKNGSTKTNQQIFDDAINSQAARDFRL